MDGNLSVSISLVSLSSIEVDHALEQENKSIKIQGAIKEIGNNEFAMNDHFLISCEMSQITEAFLESLHFSSVKINREDHYQLTGELTRE